MAHETTGRYHATTLPVATVLSDDGVENLQSHGGGDDKDKDKDHNKNWYDSFGLTTRTTGDTNQPPTYWGRFHDATAEVVGEERGGGGGYSPSLPVTTTTTIATAHLDDRLIRHAFIRKVYLILSVQLLATFAVCALMAWNASILRFCTGPGFFLYYVDICVTFASLCALHAYKRQYPTNFVLLGVFTMSMAYLVGIVTALFAQSGQGELIVEAVFITATVFIGLTLFTLQSKWDFSFLGAGLGVCLWIMVLWGFFGAVFGLAQGSVYALLGSVLFSAYIIFDTYMIAERLDPEDYIVAAIELYLDLVNLFLMILRLLSESSNRH